MVSRVHTVAFNGIDVLDIDCEVQLSLGMVAFNVVGLPCHRGAGVSAGGAGAVRGWL
jgi:hypothetical protein